MHCAEFQHRLPPAIESRDSAALAQLADHAAGCPSAACREQWAEHELVLRGVAAWQAAQLLRAPALAHRVLTELAAISVQPLPHSALVQAGSLRTTPVRTSSARWGVISVAAALLLACTLLLQPTDESLRTAGTRTLPAPDQAGVVDGITPTAEPPALAATAPKLPPARDSYVDIAHEATYFVTDLAMLVLPVAVDGDAAASGAPPGWFNRLGERLQPVKTDVEGKLGEWFGAPAT